MATVVSNGESVFVSACSKIYVLPKTESVNMQVIDVTDASNQLAIVRKPREETVDEEKENAKSKKSESVDILCSAISSCGSMICVGTTAKTILVYNTASSSLSLKRAFRIPKAPTSLTFDKNSTHVVIGDRAGHVCRYEIEKAVNEGHKDITGEMCLHEGEPLTGAISMILDVAMSSDGKYLIAADRDEKIRISRYPQAFVIQSFCMAHTEYVLSVSVLGDRLFSCGGDGIVIEWDQSSGRRLAASEKLDEKKPLRKVVAMQQDGTTLVCVVVNDSSNLVVLESVDSQLRVRTTIDIKSPLQDITLHQGHLVGITKSGIVQIDVSTATVTELPVNEELKNALAASKDAIRSYFKNVTHQNMEEYHKRKTVKMENEKEKKQRKRKAQQQRKAAANGSAVVEEGDDSTEETPAGGDAKKAAVDTSADLEA